jgi:pimeloyl-ACP methyl ester carboxylesterase
VAAIRDQLLAAVNGIFGDYLVRSHNGLAIDCGFFVDSKPLQAERSAWAAAYPNATGRVAVLVHGLMATERNWQRPAAPAPGAETSAALPREDFGTRLAADHGYTPLYVRYNTGQPIADSGAQFASLLDDLCAMYPVPITELLLIGHSMGGLVIRAACYQGNHEGAAWLNIPTRAVYIGTPHRGAPFERLGRVTANVLTAINDPVTRAIASVANLRSAGIQDLGDADLRHEDRARRRPMIQLRDGQHPVPLLPHLQHLLVAGTISDKAWLTALFGDSIVPLSSARYDGGVEPNQVVTITGIGHSVMLRDDRVYRVIVRWLHHASSAPSQEVG